MATNNPLISVCIPTYNCAKYLPQALQSVYDQNYDNFEIIVVDDGSTDNTKEVIANYKDIKYFYQNHKGISTARNLCIEKASGEYIAFLDADDYWLKDKTSYQLQFFKDKPNCLALYCSYENFIEKPELAQNKKVIEELNPDKTKNFMLSSSLIKKDVFTQFGNFIESLNVSEDTEFEYRLKSHIPEQLFKNNVVVFKRRLHGNNISLTFNYPKKMFWKCMIKHLRQRIKEK